jgi:hypothetical protein
LFTVTEITSATVFTRDSSYRSCAADSLLGIGGEQVSLAINSTFTTGFRAAGYANIENGNGSSGGVVRQYGNFSFSRVFQAGHEGMKFPTCSSVDVSLIFLLVAYYQPETAFNIFTRTMFNNDVATGRTSLSGMSNYSTTGPSSSFQIKNAVPAPQQATCYLWDILETCTPAQKAMLQNSSAIVKDFLMVGFKSANGTAVFFGNGTSKGSGGAQPNGGVQPSITPNSASKSADNPAADVRGSVQVAATALAIAMVMLSLSETDITGWLALV